VVVGVHRQHDDAERRLAAAEPPHQVKAGAVRQAYIGDHHVGPQFANLALTLRHAGGLPDDREVLVPVEGTAEALADQVVVIN
jgi:hypothetical protein